MRGIGGKVALVTGGASGLGKAIAQRLKEEGARVYISDVQFEAGRAAAAEEGFNFLEQDVCDEGRWIEVVRAVEAREGALNILVNNAGIVGSSTETTPETSTLHAWRRVFAVNVDGVFLGCRAALPALRRGGTGAIINMSSVAGLLATPYAAAYGASKAAVRQFTKSVAQYCAEEAMDVRCNSVHPGNVRTPLWDRQAAEAADVRGVAVDQIVAEGKREIPMGNFTLVEDVAAVVCFLASDDSRHITGESLSVDGGIMHCDTFHMSSEQREQRLAARNRSK